MKHTLTTLIPTLLVAFACVSSAQGQRFLSYEPEVVELDGQLVVQSKYGPPNFGEQPKTDQKVKVPVLVLRSGVSMLPADDDGPNRSVYHIKQIQLAFSNSETSHKALVGKQVVVTGTLFHAHTAHHYTEVVMNVQSIERKPVGYDQRQFAVCGIMTAYSIPHKRVFMSNDLEIQFRALVGDEPTERSIKLKNTPLTINAAIEYEYVHGSQKGTPVEVRIAMSVSEKEENARYANDHVTAGTIYKRDWRLYLTKDVFVGDTEHTLTLSCSDGNTKRK
jgi:hypothetical protein